MSISILIADDHQMIIDGLKRFIADEPDMEVVGAVGDGRTLVDLAAEIRPNVVVVDLKLPGIDGIEATQRMLTNNPDLRVVGLSMHQDMNNLVGMLRAGAKGYISKQSASRELIRAIYSVTSGHYYLCPELTTTMVEVFMNSLQDNQFTPAPTLTPREREVLRLLAQGLSTKEIAFSLRLSPKTVDAHRHNIMEKLEIDNVAGLVKYAISQGMSTA